jgi:hypothetical protein
MIAKIIVGLCGGLSDAFAVLLGSLISAIISSLVIFSIVWALECRKLSDIIANASVRYTCFLSVPFSVVGASTGFVTGLSQTPVVGNVLPAILTLLAAASTYLYSKGQKEALVALAAMISLSLSLVIGVRMGSILRP